MTTFTSTTEALAIGQLPVVHVDRTRWDDWARGRRPFLVSWSTVDRLIIGELGYVRHTLAIAGTLAKLRRESRELLAAFEERVGESLGGWTV